MPGEETNYLKVNIKHLRQKVDDNSRDPRITLTERGLGYKFA